VSSNIQDVTSLVPRPSMPPLIDHLEYSASNQKLEA